MLVRGITGFRGPSDPPLKATDHSAFLTALHNAVRQVGGRVGESRNEGVLRSYLEIEVAAGACGDLSVLFNNHEPYVAFSERTTGQPRFVSCPGLAAGLVAADSRLRVLAVSELDRAITESDLETLGKAERRQLEYWKPARIGDVIFNWWD